MGTTNIEVLKKISQEKKVFRQKRRMLRELIISLSQRQKDIKGDEKNKAKKGYGAWQITTLLIEYANLKGKQNSHSLKKWDDQKYFFGAN